MTMKDLKCVLRSFFFHFQKLPSVNKELAQKLQEMKGSEKLKVLYIFNYAFFIFVEFNKCIKKKKLCQKNTSNYLL